MPLNIIYQDTDYVAIDKPSGLLVHRTKLDSLATEFALQMLRDQIEQQVYPCHRLDRPTSGILLFALNNEAHSFAMTQFAEKQVKKEYHAMVRGWTEDSGSIDHDLRSEDNPEKSQSAQTEYSRVAQSQLELPVGRYPSARFSLVKLTPLTGRTHQLRRHLAHIRHPILGDTRHGDGTQNRFIREHFNIHRLLLRATHLELQHPNRAQNICIDAGPEPEFEAALSSLKLR